MTATPRSCCLHHAPVIVALHEHRCVVSCSVFKFFFFYAVWYYAPSLQISSILSGVPLFQSFGPPGRLDRTSLVNPVHWRHHRLRVHSISPVTFVSDPVLLIPNPILHAMSLVMALDPSRSLCCLAPNATSFQSFFSFHTVLLKHLIIDCRFSVLHLQVDPVHMNMA